MLRVRTFTARRKLYVHVTWTLTNVNQKKKFLQVCTEAHEQRD